MIEFKDILDVCQAEAIASKVSPTEESIYRDMCRSYSKMFNTPLPLVLDMDPEHVILNVYEERLASLDETKYESLEKMLDTVLTIEDPNYERVKEDKLSKDIEKYEKEEEERVASGRAIHPSLKNRTPVVKKDDEELEEYTKPTSGSVDFSGMKESEES